MTKLESGKESSKATTENEVNACEQTVSVGVIQTSDGWMIHRATSQHSSGTPSMDTYPPRANSSRVDIAYSTYRCHPSRLVVTLRATDAVQEARNKGNRKFSVQFYSFFYRVNKCERRSQLSSHSTQRSLYLQWIQSCCSSPFRVSFAERRAATEARSCLMYKCRFHNFQSDHSSCTGRRRPQSHKPETRTRSGFIRFPRRSEPIVRTEKPSN